MHSLRISQLYPVDLNFWYLLYLSVRPFDDLFYEDRFNDDDDEYDSEDSNQENHFGNDYPDEDDDVDLECSDDDDDDSGGEREVCEAIEKFVFGDDDEDQEVSAYMDSSDDEDCNPYQDPYVHTVEVGDEETFGYDVDLCDVERYGTAYARYKKRILKNLNPGQCGDSDGGDNDIGTEISDEEHYHSAGDQD